MLRWSSVCLSLSSFLLDRFYGIEYIYTCWGGDSSSSYDHYRFLLDVGGLLFEQPFFEDDFHLGGPNVVFVVDQYVVGLEEGPKATAVLKEGLEVDLLDAVLVLELDGEVAEILVEVDGDLGVLAVLVDVLVYVGLDLQVVFV